MDKKIKLTGFLKEEPKKEYTDNAWVETGTTYIISDVKDVIKIK